jgi:putative transposase
MTQEHGPMKKSRVTEEQIAYALRESESGTAVADVCRQSQATFYIWKNKFAHLGVSELRRLRQLEEENSRLKRLVADLTLDKHMLAEALGKKRVTPTRRRTTARWFQETFGVSCARVPARRVQSRGVVSPKSGEGSVGAAAPHLGARHRAATV